MKSYLMAFFRLPAAVKRFIATESLLGIGIGIYSLILNLHLLDMGLSEGEIGAINATAALITGFASIPAGLAMRRIGRKLALVSGLLLMAAGYSFFGLSNDLFSFYVAQSVVSVGLTLLVTSEIQLLFRYCNDRKDEPRAYGALFASFTLFLGAGTVIGGWLPNVLAWGDARYEGSLYAAAFCLAIGGLLRAVLLPAETNAPTHAALTGVQENKQLHDGAKKADLRNIAVFSLLLFLSGLLFGVVGPFLNIIVKLRFGLPDEPLSVALAVYGFALFIGSLMMPYVMERWGTGRTFTGLYIAEFLLLLLLAAPLPVGAFLLPLVLRGGTYTMLNNLTDSQTMSAIHDDQRNLFAGARTVSRNLGVSLASYSAGFVLSAKHYGWPFLLAAAVLIAHAAFFFLIAKPAIETPQAQVDK